MSVLARHLRPKPSPDLSTQSRIVIQQANPAPSLSSHRRRRHSARPSAHNNYIEARAHPVTTSMPAAQASMQVRLCATPFTIARHSMQMPMPHSGARASPFTENRQGSPAIITAAATLVPTFTRTFIPFTVTQRPSLIDHVLSPEIGAH
jgi:hypothetical protein